MKEPFWALGDEGTEEKAIIFLDKLRQNKLSSYIIILFKYQTISPSLTEVLVVEFIHLHLPLQPPHVPRVKYVRLVIRYRQLVPIHLQGEGS